MSDYVIKEKSLTKEQEQFVAEGFKEFDEHFFHAKNKVKQYTFLIEDSCCKRNYVASLKARLSWGNFHIVELFVRKEMRHKGIGTALIKHAVSVARQDKAKFISVKTSYIAARRFYEKLGFQLHNTMYGYASGLCFWTLVLKL